MNQFLRLVLMVGMYFIALSENVVADPIADAFRAYEAKNYSKAAKLYKPLAQNGNANAQMWLGMLYYDGNGVAQDLNEAAIWFRLSAEQGDGTAQAMLGSMYFSGDGVKQNDVEAMKWLRLSADQGKSTSQYLIGEMYMDGRVVAYDALEAVKWFQLAAEQGFVKAQLRLGDWYGFSGCLTYIGEGRCQNCKDYPREYNDPAESLKWYRLAAKQNSAPAQYQVGSAYELGYIVSRDYAEAVKWYRLAAEQGYDFAEESLGNSYSEGKGVPQDYVLAYMWTSISAAHAEASRSANIFKKRDLIAAKMTPQQIGEAQRLSRECAGKKYKGC